MTANIFESWPLDMSCHRHR